MKQQIKPWLMVAAISFTTHAMAVPESRVGPGITARAAHGTVRDSLPSYGSCYLILLTILSFLSPSFHCFTTVVLK